jgi:hypothetical protein
LKFRMVSNLSCILSPFSIPSPSLNDRPPLGDRSLHSYKHIYVLFDPQSSIVRRCAAYLFTTSGAPGALLHASNPSLYAAIMHTSKRNSLAPRFGSFLPGAVHAITF